MSGEGGHGGDVAARQESAVGDSFSNVCDTTE